MLKLKRIHSSISFSCPFLQTTQYLNGRVESRDTRKGLERLFVGERAQCLFGLISLPSEKTVEEGENLSVYDLGKRVNTRK